MFSSFGYNLINTGFLENFPHQKNTKISIFVNSYNYFDGGDFPGEFL